MAFGVLLFLSVLVSFDSFWCGFLRKKKERKTGFWEVVGLGCCHFLAAALTVFLGRLLGPLISESAGRAFGGMLLLGTGLYKVLVGMIGEGDRFHSGLKRIRGTVVVSAAAGIAGAGMPTVGLVMALFHVLSAVWGNLCGDAVLTIWILERADIPVGFALFGAGVLYVIG